jgi:hypothetical protein
VGILLTLATWALAFAAAVPPSRLWRDAAPRVVAFGVLSFGALVVAFQVPAVISAAIGRGMVGATSALLTSATLCGLVWLSPLGRRPREAASVTRPREAGNVAGSSSDAGRVSLRSRLSPRTLRLAMLPIVACIAFYIVAVIDALSAPPRGWDVLTYHLPRAVSWLQHGDLGIYGSTGAFYPGNAEIALLSILSTGSDVLAPLVQLPFAALAGVAVYGLARELGARARSALVAAGVFLFAPMVFFQSTIAKDDVVVTALTAAGVLFLVRAVGRGRRPRNTSRLLDVALAGFALGLALGTKYSILPFVAGAVPIAFLALGLAGRGGDHLGVDRRPWRGAAIGAAIFVAAIAVPSIFWFVRNAVVSGNPVYPLTLNPGAWIGTAGLEQQFQFVPNLASWWIFPWLDRHIGGSYSGSAGFGWAFAVLFLPGLAVGALRARAIGSSRRYLALLALIVMGIVAWWFGKHHLPRFLLPVMALTCAPVALLFDAARRWLRAALAVVALGAVIVSSAETVRIVFGDDDITWSYQGGVGREEFYRMPDLIYRLPSGTGIFLLAPTAQDYFQTFRYPLVGRLPGNDVVMEDDVGFTLDRRSPEGIRRGLEAADIDYVFFRGIGMKPQTTWFDEDQRHFRKVYDEVGLSYPWYREVVAYTETGDYLGPGTVLTKIYRIVKQ